MKMFLRRAVALLIDTLILALIAVPTGGVAWIIYEVCLLTLWNGQTVGKKIMDLQVKPVPGWGTSIVRTLMKIVSAMPLGLGFLWMLWDKNGQTWHDKIAGTNVK